MSENNEIAELLENSSEVAKLLKSINLHTLSYDINTLNTLLSKNNLFYEKLRQLIKKGGIKNKYEDLWLRDDAQQKKAYTDEQADQGKTIIKNVLTGLVIVFISFILVQSVIFLKA